MSRYVFKMPDLGEGTVEAELVAWHVKPGDRVAEDQVMAEVMTDKAAVEVPAPVSGRVLSVKAAPGDKIAVGAELIEFETNIEGESAEEKPSKRSNVTAPSTQGNNSNPVADSISSAQSAGRVMASPATRRRAHEAGIDLARIRGSGPNGRIQREDLESQLSHRAGSEHAHAGTAQSNRLSSAPHDGVDEIKVIGLRRRIAERMSEAAQIPHFSYVEEVDVTELESLRSHLNRRQADNSAALTYLPFLGAALVRALERFPQCNALYDSERGVLLRHHAVHLGIATQTADGLMVPVVRHAESLSLFDLAEEIRRVSDAARTKKAAREALTGSTITITSLGRLGGIVSTPILNAPEVAIIGVNKAVERPVAIDGAVTIRRMMNLSSSFDHRFVDGHDAASMIQALKEMLEHPATIFMRTT